MMLNVPRISTLGTIICLPTQCIHMRAG